MPKLPEIDIIKELSTISKLGFLKSLRKDNTGVGYTLETLLKIKENNDAEPDFSFKGIPVELKTQREHTGSNITLFTLEPPRGTKGKFKDIELLRKYGYVRNGRTNLYVTMAVGELCNPQGFKLELNDKTLLITHKKEGIVWTYPIEYIVAKIKKKLSHKVLLVTAESKVIKGKEHFHYKKAELFSNVTEKGFIDLIRAKSLVVEFRMHINSKGGARNHGTPFRINLRHLDKLFANRKRIL